MNSIPELSTEKKVVGLNQTKKAIVSGRAVKVYVAADADDMFSTQVKKLCNAGFVTVDESATMLELGKACGIDVGCAVCAIIN